MKGLVSGLLRVEQHLGAIAHHAGRWFLGMGQRVPGAAPKRRAFALVAAAEDGDLPAALGQRPGELLHHRGLAGAPDSEIPDHDDETASGGHAGCARG